MALSGKAVEEKLMVAFCRLRKTLVPIPEEEEE
jgi:hypothetical protein